MELIIEALTGTPAGAQPVEVVERKGIGHPDTICDGIAEQIGVALSRYYLTRFGTILHHNVDKILLCGGAADAAFRGGEVTAPVELYLAGRVTAEYRGERLPVEDIAVEECRAWLRTHLRALDPLRHVRIFPRFRPTSGDLTQLFAKGQGSVPLSNDTSCGAGFAPFTALENAVLAIERALNSAETKDAHPAIGEDIKVMGVRNRARMHFTIGCAMIGRHLTGIADYVEARDAARQVALTAARSVTGLDLEVVVNAADDIERGSVYLTVTGTSAEAGDDGETGRGNRVSGLITPYRPMTVEAAAGKNPVSHVGKLYNLAAAAIAARAACEVPGVLDAICVLTSQIGRPIGDPEIVNLRVSLEERQNLHAISEPLRQIVQSHLEQFPELQNALLESRVSLY